MSEHEKHDTESQQKTAAPDAAAEETTEMVAEPVRSGGGRLLGSLALLLALGAYGGGYWFWTQWQQQRAADAQAQQALLGQLNNLDAAQKMLANELDQSGNRIATLDKGQETLNTALTGINERLGRNREAWVVAEAQYLLEMGDRRLQLERDVAGAIAALSAADQRLASLGDPLLTPVRARISDELQALRAVPQVDVDGISLELASLSKAVETLPVSGAPQPLPTSAAAPVAGTGWRGFVAALWTDLKGLVVVRHNEAGKLPLLTPDQRELLRQNMRLKLETARLALLQGHAQVYRGALQDADGWLGQYFDGSAAATKAAHEVLTRLAATDIAPSLPSVGQSLRLLRAIGERVGESRAKAPAAKGAHS